MAWLCRQTSPIWESTSPGTASPTLNTHLNAGTARRVTHITRRTATGCATNLPFAAPFA
jgi:hypothetical protein